MEIRKLVGMLAEEDALRLFSALVLDGPAEAGPLAERSGLSKDTAERLLTRLERGGLAAQDDAGWRANPKAFRTALKASPVPAEDVSDREQVLKRFVIDGRIVQFPAQRAKKLIILAHVANTFEPGVRYPEKDVNARLRLFHDDHAALRRYLIDEGLLSREDGLYWRSG